MIEIDVRKKSFGETQVLGSVRFRIARGETVAVLGPSGIGKTTLLQIVAGLDDRYEGTITRPASCAIVFQEPTLLPWRSTIQNILLLHPHLSEDDAIAALGRVGIADRADLFPGQLSLGQQRRLALARAFAGEPEFLIMDEPFVSLDEETAERMLSLVERLIADASPATLFVTHSESEAKRLADRVLRLNGQPATISEM